MESLNKNIRFYFYCVNRVIMTNKKFQTKVEQIEYIIRA